MPSWPAPWCAIWAAPKPRRSSRARVSISNPKERMRLVALLLSCAVAGGAAAADIRVLAAAALEPGLVKIADQFRRETNNRVRIQFAAGPLLERRLSTGEPPDVLIASPGLMNDQLRRGKIDAEAHTFIGRVGIGVAVRAGEPEPDIAALDRFKRALLSADSIVYSQASSGLYLEKLFDLLGIAEQLNKKTTRYVNSAQVLEHIMGGKGIEMGFAAITEIRQFEAKGLKFVGPLPEQVQSSTPYSAAVVTDAPTEDIAKEFVTYLGTPAAKAILAAAGIE